MNGARGGTVRGDTRIGVIHLGLGRCGTGSDRLLFKRRRCSPAFVVFVGSSLHSAKRWSAGNIQSSFIAERLTLESNSGRISEWPLLVDVHLFWPISVI